MSIERFISQRCVGYRKRADGSVESCIEGTVLNTDGSTGVVYSMAYSEHGWERMTPWTEEKPDGLYQVKSV